MPAKAFVIFFRYKFLLLAPFLVALPLAVAFVLLSGTTAYTTSGKVDVYRPTFLSSEATAGFNDYITLAANQANFVRQRLQTEDFTGRVAANASKGYSRVITSSEVRDGAWAAEIGPNLLAIGYTGGDAEAARRISQATIDEYAKVEKEQTASDAAIAQSVKQARVEDLMTVAERSANELDDYLVSNPLIARSIELLNQDAGYRSLSESVKQDQQALRDAESDLSTTAAFVDATVKGQAKTFSPIAADAPQLPIAPIARSKMDLVGPPAMAMLLAVSLAAAMYGFIYRTDHSLRSREDLAAMLPNVTFLGTVPDISAPTRRIWPRGLVRVTATSGDDVEDALRRAT